MSEKEKDITVDWIRWYPMKFITSLDVMHMEAQEVGAYVMLLFSSFPTDGYLPDNEDQLRKISKLGKRAWEKSKDVILAKFKREGGKIWNETFVNEIKNSKAVIQQNRDRATKAAEKRWNVKKLDARALPEQSSTNAHYTTLHKTTENKIESTGAVPPPSSTNEVVKKEKIKRFVPPVLAEVTVYFTELMGPAWGEAKVNAQANKFIDHYTTVGWKVGKNPMKDWKAAIRKWVGNEKNFSGSQPSMFPAGNNNSNIRKDLKLL